MRGLGWIVRPMDLQVFMDQHWERAPVHIAADAPARFRELADLDAVDALISERGLSYPALRVVAQGQRPPLPDWTVPSLPWGDSQLPNFVKPDRIYELIRRGHSVVFDHVHRIWDPIGALNRSLEEQVHARVGANLIFTPAGSQGFVPHYDTQDVLALQCEGRKRWTISAPPIYRPLSHQPTPAAGLQHGEILMEVELEPGDALYLPKGFVHSAQTEDEHSIHLSFTFKPTTWYDVLRDALAHFDDPALHDTVRFDSRAPDLDEDQEALFEALLARFVDQVDPADAVDRLGRQFVRSRLPRLRGALQDAARLGRIGPDTPLRRRPGLMYQIVHAGGDVELRFHAHVTTVPARLRQTLRHMAQAPRFTLQELPGGLSGGERVQLARHLMREGFLVFAD